MLPGNSTAWLSFDQFHDVRGRLVQRDADRFSASHLDRVHILREGPLGVLRVCRVRNGNGDTRRHGTIVAPLTGPLIELQQEISAIDQFAIDYTRFGEHLVGFYRAGAVNVKDFMAMGCQPVRYQHAMALEIHAFGAHVGGT